MRCAVRCSVFNPRPLAAWRACYRGNFTDSLIADSPVAESGRTREFFSIFRYAAPMTATDIPQKLGRYRILRRLGAGGMAEVFLAKSSGAEGIEKLLVVKRVLPSFARSGKFISMFVDEAKVAMRLNHPNIVQVYAFEQEGNEFLLAMEFVDGVDLGRLVKAARHAGRPLPYGLAAYIVTEVSRGLDYAHKRRDEHNQPMEIVHRDVSPQNVLLTYDGFAKIADFGIAKAKLVSEETGVIKGKFAYMSPEQARGERIDARSDVYSLGILLAELLMNRPMFPGKHGLDVLEKVRDGERTLPSHVNAQVPRALDRIVERATAKNPEERYQSARSLASALTQYLHSQEDLWDGEALEKYIAEVSPKPEDSAIEVLPSLPPGSDVLQQTRERRRVVVIAGRALEGDDADEVPSMSEEARKILDDIAYKADAVLTWPQGEGRGAFRLIIGLGQSTVNDPLRAVSLSTDIIDALAGLSADRLVTLSACFGLSRGMVSTMRDTSGRLLQYAPVGNVLDVAEQLATVGQRGEVLVSGAVYRLVRRDYRFEEDSRDVRVDTRTSEGERKLAVWKLLGSLSADERAQQQRKAPAGFLGRARELDTIESHWVETCEAKRIRFVSLVGDLGVGKTALVQAATETLLPAPTVVRAECTFGETDSPYGVIAQLMRQTLGLKSEAGADEVAQGVEARLAEVIRSHSQRELMMRSVHAMLGTGTRSGEHEERGRVLRRVVEVLLGAMVERGPVMIWVDGLQWIDQPSLTLISSMRTKRYSFPIMVLFSSRPDERLEKALSGIPRLELGELDEAAQEELVTKLFDAEVPEEIKTLILSRAGGNPFFVHELIEALNERGVVGYEGQGAARRVIRHPGVPLSLPTTLEGVVAARLDELDEDERRAARWLAAAGAGLSSRDLSTMAQLPMEDAVAALAERGLVVRREGQIAFANNVIRQVAYEATALDDRARMHRRIAQHFSGRQDIARGRIARHLEQAGERAAAARAYMDAAKDARSVYSNRDALRFYSRALELLSPDDDELRFTAHQGREQILRGLGRPNEQSRELQAMKAIASRGGSPRRRAAALLGLARFEVDNAQLDIAAELLPEAIEAARAAGDLKMELDALRVEAELARNRGEPDHALRSCEIALERAGYGREVLASRGSILVQQGILRRRLGRADKACESYTEAIVIFRRLGIRRQEAFALNSLGVALGANGEYEDAILAIRASIHIDRETGDRMRLGRKLSNVGQMYEALGDRKNGMRFLTRALDVFEVVDDRAGRCDALSGLAEVLLLGEGPDAARAPLDQARRIAKRLSNYEIARERIVRARMERVAGALPASEEAARDGLRAASEDGLVSFQAQCQAELAMTLAASEKFDEARDFASKALEQARESGVENLERVYGQLASVFAAVGEEDAEDEVRGLARDYVSAKAAAIRSDALRKCFLDSPDVRPLR